MNNLMNNNYLSNKVQTYPFNNNFKMTCPLNLRQIDGWDSPKELFINSVKWTLRKDYRDSSGSIPNIMNIQFDDINSGYMKVDELSNDKTTIFLYLYYGTILPKIGSYEKPMSVFFQWFNDKPVQLRKDLISEADWNRANVYVSDYGSLQLTTKNALFNAVNEKQNVQPTEPLPDIKIGQNFESEVYDTSHSENIQIRNQNE